MTFQLPKFVISGHFLFFEGPNKLKTRLKLSGMRFLLIVVNKDRLAPLILW
jgi:hypothetical protein